METIKVQIGSKKRLFTSKVEAAKFLLNFEDDEILTCESVEELLKLAGW